MQRILLFIFVSLFQIGFLFSQNQPLKLEKRFNYVVPGQFEYCKRDLAGRSVLPSGRIVSPVGDILEISRSAFGLAVNSKETRGIILHNNAISIVNLQNKKFAVERFPEYGKEKEVGLFQSTFIGASFGKDPEVVAISGGDNGKVFFFNLSTKKIIDSIDCNLFHPEALGESMITDIVWDTFSNEIWILDRAWQQLYRVNVQSKKLIARVNTGRIPFGLQLSSDRKHLVFVNVGVYNYPLLPGVTPKNKDSFYLHFPPYAAHTKEAEEGVIVENKVVPGLGKSNVEESMSAWVVNTLTNKISAKIITGKKIGEFIEDAEIVGGSHPNSVVCFGNYAYISQSQSDEIAVLNLNSLKIEMQIPIKTGTFLDNHRGYFPYGLDIDHRNQRLFVALLGYNAVAVIDLKKKQCTSFIPAAWGTSRVKYLSRTNELLVTSIRGLGAGPNGGNGFKEPIQGLYIGDIQLGILQKVNLNQSSNQFQQWSKSCMNQTFVQKADSSISKLASFRYSAKQTDSTKIKHIVYITKENRTFDEVFGQLSGVRGDSTLSRFGVNAERFLIDQIDKVSNEDLNKYGFDTLMRKQFVLGLDNLRIAPNHLKIAKEFGISDNFYCDSDASIHGHHWMVGTIPNEYVETNSANAGSFKLFSKSPGGRFPRTTGAQDPEDYNQIGGLWESLDRNKISVYNFGEANEYTDVQEEWYDTINGTALAVPFPMPKSIYSKTSRNYAGYNTSIPDQFRVEQFETEFTKLWIDGKNDMPELLTIQLPNDHTSSPRPKDGYPFIQSYVADNDLALGRMLQFLSHTKYWKNMLVIITEDDPQGGVDHIDAHRSVLLLAGPHVKRNYISTKHANFGSIIRTIYTLKGLPSVNHFDATATVLNDFLTETPNYKPYIMEKSDLRVFDPELAMKKYNRNIPWREVKMVEPMDNEKFIKQNNQK